MTRDPSDLSIAFLTAEYPPENAGGAGLSSELIVNGLRDAGIDVDVYALTGDVDGCEQVRANHFELPAGDGRRIPETIGANVSVLRHLPSTEQYDVLHTYNNDQLPAAVWNSDVPVVATMNNMMWVCIDPQRYLREGCPSHDVVDSFAYLQSTKYAGLLSPVRLSIEVLGKGVGKRADAFTVQTEGMRAVLGNCGYSTDKINVVPNLLDDRFLVDEARDESDEKTLLFVGRLNENKGVLDVVRTFQSLPAECRAEWRLKIYGDGPLREEVERRISDDPRIEIGYAPYEALPSVYATADAMVHASKYPEPFSRTWLEAMATRTPIVCSENPSSQSVLGEIAELYDPFDSTAMRAALLDVLCDERRREEMSRTGRAAVTAYAIENVIPMYVNEYRSVCGRER